MDTSRVSLPQPVVSLETPHYSTKTDDSVMGSSTDSMEGNSSLDDEAHEILDTESHKVITVGHQENTLRSRASFVDLSKAGSVTTRRQIKGVKFLVKLQENTVHDLLLGLRWYGLLGLVVIFYVIVSGISGLLLFVAHETPVSMFEYWYRGFMQLLISPAFTPETNGEKAVIMISCFLGSMVVLVLFGLVWSKFSSRDSSCVFADKVMLQQLPPVMGGYTMMTFRFAHMQSAQLMCPDIRCSFLKRVEMAGGARVFQESLDIFDSTPVIPSQYFFSHVINETSPFFDPNPANPAHCNFRGCLRLMVAIGGWDAEQTHHVGSSDWGLHDVILDAAFMPSMNSIAGTINFCNFSKFTPIPYEASWAALGVTRKSIGLPPQFVEKCYDDPYVRESLSGSEC